MLSIVQTTLFKRRLKRMRRRGMEMSLLDDVVGRLQRQEPLPARFRDHELVGSRRGIRDCHVAPDWVLLYRVDDDQLALLLLETGTHSDLDL